MNTMPAAEEMIVLGKIVSVHGIRGEVKVYSFTDPLDNLLDYRRWTLKRGTEVRQAELVSGRVLNEGVDVPDCRVAIIVSGNSTKREYIQRLGGVLRPKAGQALLYELITSSTMEEDVARRRK